MLDWDNFNNEFIYYILNTIGLFTINQPQACFKLERFLERRYICAINNNKVHISQLEMLMALGIYIDIQENKQNINIETFPKNILIYLETLIKKNHLQLNQISNLKKEILNYDNKKFLIEI
jgi:hypothetical protein